MSLFYLFLFTGFGAMYPLLPLFLRERGLSDSEIGWIAGMGPMITLLFQPIWGMICDRFQAQRAVLMLTMLLSAGIALLFPAFASYWPLLLVFVGVAAFNSSGVPIADSLALSYVYRHGGSYGSFRLWGAVGFACASWLAGRIAEGAGLSTIFYLYAAALVGCVLVTRSLPRNSQSMSMDLRVGLRRLFGIPRFTIFLFASFLIFGTIQANNSYYGIFFTAIGGSVAGVGLSFLIAAGSEAPVMQFAGRLIRRYGITAMLMIAGTISAGRWLWYGFAPSETLVTVLLFLQGISVGLLLPAAAQFVKETAPDEIQTSALGIYSAVSNGLGSMVGTITGGWVLEQFGIFTLYTVFGIASLIGVGAVLSLRWIK